MEEHWGTFDSTVVLPESGSLENATLTVFAALAVMTAACLLIGMLGRSISRRATAQKSRRTRVLRKKS